MSETNFWKELDETVRPKIAIEVERKGWKLLGGGAHQWTAVRNVRDSEFEAEITTMNPFALIERIEAHERRLRQQRARRMGLAELGFSDDD